MNIEEIIKKKFGDKVASIEAGELLFRQSDALKVIDECEKHRVIILGMDFWQIWDKNIVEVNSTKWDNINSGEEASEKTINAARKLISGLPDNTDYVSFVLKENT